MDAFTDVTLTVCKSTIVVKSSITVLYFHATLHNNVQKTVVIHKDAFELRIEYFFE